MGNRLDGMDQLAEGLLFNGRDVHQVNPIDLFWKALEQIFMAINGNFVISFDQSLHEFFYEGLIPAVHIGVTS